MLSEENRKKIIFSADDFGVSPLCDENILKAANLGKLDRVEIMVNENLTAQSVAGLKKTGVKLDLHLHLIDYHCDYWQGNRILDRGAIERVIIFMFSYFSKNSPKKVATEWETQIKRFKEIAGEYPAGLGSHEYIHYFTPYFKIALNLCEKYQIPYLRFGTDDFAHPAIISKILNWLRHRDLKYFRNSKLETSEYMVSFDWSNNLEFLNKLPAGSQAEVVFHPERPEELKFLEEL